MDYTTTIKMVRHDGPLTVLSLENETGTAEMNNWEVYPGITLSYLEAHMEEFSCYAPLRPDVFAINHCEEGRIECRFKNGEYLYMGKGDMSVGRRSCSDYCHMAYFPSSHYHGLSILVDEKRAQSIIDRLLEQESFSLVSLCDRFCSDSDFGIIVQENEAMKHLFYELYHVPPAIRNRYFRLKILEIFLFLSTFQGKMRLDRPYLTRRQVETVKAVHQELVADLSCHCTIEAMAERYNMAPTSLNRCFKDVYGTTMYQYQKELRMAKAMELLVKTEKSVLEVANCVGYENSSKFAVAFKKMAGCLPREYRKQQVFQDRLEA